MEIIIHYKKTNKHEDLITRLKKIVQMPNSDHLTLHYLQVLRRLGSTLTGGAEPLDCRNQENLAKLTAVEVMVLKKLVEVPKARRK